MCPGVGWGEPAGLRLNVYSGARPPSLLLLDSSSNPLKCFCSLLSQTVLVMEVELALVSHCSDEETETQQVRHLLESSPADLSQTFPGYVWARARPHFLSPLTMTALDWRLAWVSPRAQSRHGCITVSYQGPRSLPGCCQSCQNPTDGTLTWAFGGWDGLGRLLCSSLVWLKSRRQLGWPLEVLESSHFHAYQVIGWIQFLAAIGLRSQRLADYWRGVLLAPSSYSCVAPSNSEKFAPWCQSPSASNCSDFCPAAGENSAFKGLTWLIRFGHLDNLPFAIWWNVSRIQRLCPQSKTGRLHRVIGGLFLEFCLPLRCKHPSMCNRNKNLCLLNMY